MFDTNKNKQKEDGFGPFFKKWTLDKPRHNLKLVYINEYGLSTFSYLGPVLTENGAFNLIIPGVTP